MIRYALAYPNAFPVGMANLGFQTVYGILTSRPDTACERFFSGRNRSFETGSELGSFDVVAFSLSFEGDYPNAVAMLTDAGIDPKAARRGDGRPLVLAGGMAPSLNPEPLAAVADVIFTGEAENGLERLHLFFLENLNSGRERLLRKLAALALPGVYVPAAYETREEGGRIERQTLWEAPGRVDVVKAPPGWEPARSRIVAPDDAFGGAFLIEISRGCPHGCRFCATGHLLRPARFIPCETLRPRIVEGAHEHGRVGLVGAAVSDHPSFREIASLVVDNGASLSVSSFRAENLDGDVLDLLKKGGLRTLTVAIEAGSERLRRRIGKTLDEKHLIEAVGAARAAGIKNMRIYAMIGLPGEEETDVAELAGLAARAKKKLGGGELTLSVAPFVPKPFTPFQWEPFLPEGVLTRRARLLASIAAPKGVDVTVDSPKWARLQALFSMGGRKAGEILAANPSKSEWGRILKSPEVTAIVERRRGAEDALPWDFLGSVPSREYLLAELEGSAKGSPPSECPSPACGICGICGA